MSSDAFLTEPAGGAGRASQAGALAPLLDQEFDSDTLYALRAAVQAHADHAGLSEGRTGDVVLAVHELAANAIAHGAGHGRLRMWDQAGTLSCEVVDGGPADSDAHASPPGHAASPPGHASPDGHAAAEPWPSRQGHGLWLVRQVADQLNLRSGPHGTRAVITFALPLPRDH
jgi:anti-sigma regulatory factor (Ser/Thr protein kinase)